MSETTTTVPAGFTGTVEEFIALREKMAARAAENASSQVEESAYKDEMILAVDEACFTTDPKYNKGQSLILRLDGVDEIDGKRENRFIPMGNNFESARGGQAAAPIDPKKAKINASSQLGKLIAALVGCELGDPSDIIDLDFREASTYVRTRWKLELGDVTNPVTKEVKRQLIFVRYLGRGQVAATPAAGASATVGGYAAPSANFGLTEDLAAQLTALAKAHSTNATFLSMALAIPGVTQNQQAVSAITSGAMHAQFQAA